MVFFHGIEIWTSGTFDRVLRRHPSIRAVTVSSFSAGTMVGVRSPRILAPNVQTELFSRLLGIERVSPLAGHELRVLSVFRLQDYAGKGGRQLVGALADLRASGHPIALTVAGRDAPSELLDADLARHGRWLTAVRSPSTADLVACYEDADLFVLATRQQRRPFPAGEGFGIVLAEAALAGLPVIGPASGGSHDAFIEGVTGVSPGDDS